MLSLECWEVKEDSEQGQRCSQQDPGQVSAPRGTHRGLGHSKGGLGAPGPLSITLLVAFILLLFAQGSPCVRGQSSSCHPGCREGMGGPIVCPVRTPYVVSRTPQCPMGVSPAPQWCPQPRPCPQPNLLLQPPCTHSTFTAPSLYPQHLHCTHSTLTAASLHPQHPHCTLPAPTAPSLQPHCTFCTFSASPASAPAPWEPSGSPGPNVPAPRCAPLCALTPSWAQMFPPNTDMG